MIENDIKAGAVTLDILKLARDPKSALLNLVERVDIPTKTKLESFELDESDTDFKGKEGKDGELINDIKDKLSPNGN